MDRGVSVMQVGLQIVQTRNRAEKGHVEQDQFDSVRIHILILSS